MPTFLYFDWCKCHHLACCWMRNKVYVACSHACSALVQLLSHYLTHLDPNLAYFPVFFFPFNILSCVPHKRNDLKYKRYYMKICNCSFVVRVIHRDLVLKRLCKLRAGREFWSLFWQKPLACMASSLSRLNRLYVLFFPLDPFSSAGWSCSTHFI